MSVLCCYTPDFLLQLAQRQQPGLAGQAVALMGEDERVLAVSLPARAAGVRLQMSAQEARRQSSEIQLAAIDMAAAQQTQEAFTAVLAETGLPVESLGFGAAYIDLRPVAEKMPHAQALGGELGRQMRRALGQPLQPALGWDHGKFTARAAALQAQPGRMRLVPQADEVHFLGPLPITILPLPDAHIQQLRWLGVRTLGQFAKLPKTAVVQRFGEQGKLAQRLAQGKDDRPVRPSAHQQSPPIEIDFDPPTALLGEALTSAMTALRRSVASLAKRCEGIRRLQVALRFQQGSIQRSECVFVQPTVDLARLQAALSARLQATPWAGELVALRLSVLEAGEQLPQQLALLDQLDDPDEQDDAGLLNLVRRYPGTAYRGHIVDANHPEAERRSALATLAPGA